MAAESVMTIDRGARENASMPRRRRAWAMIAATFALVMTMFLPLTMPAASAQEEFSPPRTVYIAETGHTLDQLFLDLWRNAGGATAYGYPITAEFEDAEGHTVQYLQYARFEYWPEGDANGNTVLVAELGEELRPINVKRSMASFSTTTPGSTATESMRFAAAWLPVEESAIDSANGVVFIDETGHSLRGGFLDFWERSGGVDYLGNPLTEEYTRNDITYQVFERGQLAWEVEGEPYMVPVGKVLADKYALDQEPIAQGDIPTYDEALFIPPPEPVLAGYDPNAGGIVIDINLSSQFMTVFQGDNPIIETYVSTGRPGFDTPPGSYVVNTKVDVQDMEGVLGGEYYNVPSVPWVMYFTDRGHAIHGAYWHNNFGAVMSHGCINLPVETAEFLYSISSIGTRVEIHW